MGQDQQSYSLAESRGWWEEVMKAALRMADLCDTHRCWGIFVRMLPTIISFVFLDVYVHALFVFGPDVLGLSAKTAIR